MGSGQDCLTTCPVKSWLNPSQPTAQTPSKPQSHLIFTLFTPVNLPFILPSKWKKTLHPRCTYKGGWDLLTTVNIILDPKEKSWVQRKSVRRTHILIGEQLPRPSQSFSSTLTLISPKSHYYSLFWMCVLFLNILFVCTYSKTCLKRLKSEAEYRIWNDLVLHSDLLFYFVLIFLVYFRSSSVDIWCCNVGKKEKCKILYHLWNMYKREM